MMPHVPLCQTSTHDIDQTPPAVQTPPLLANICACAVTESNIPTSVDATAGTHTSDCICIYLSIYMEAATQYCTCTCKKYPRNSHSWCKQSCDIYYECCRQGRSGQKHSKGRKCRVSQSGQKRKEVKNINKDFLHVIRFHCRYQAE